MPIDSMTWPRVETPSQVTGTGWARSFGRRNSVSSSATTTRACGPVMIPPCPELSEADQHDAGRDHGGGGHAPPAERFAEHRHADQRGEPDDGLPDRGHLGERRPRLRPQDDAVRDDAEDAC